MPLPRPMKKLHCLTVGPLAENCYLLWEDAPAPRPGLVVDPGDDFPKIRDFLESESIRPLGVLLTHAHFDHIGALPALTEAYGVPVWCPEADHPLYHSPDNGMPPWYPAVKNLPPLSSAPLPEFGFQVLNTPGHSPGSTSYYFPEEGLVLTGDTLFAGSVGRTDLPGGSETVLMHSIRTVLFSLPPKTLVFPGHGPRTTIGIERMDPFFGMP